MSIVAIVMLLIGGNMAYKIIIIFFKVNLMDFSMAIVPTVLLHASLIIPLSVILFLLTLKKLKKDELKKQASKVM
jgi:hypothetical protein